MKKLIVSLMAGLILAFSVMCVSAAPASNGSSEIKASALAQRHRMHRRYRMHRRHVMMRRHHRQMRRMHRRMRNR